VEPWYGLYGTQIGKKRKEGRNQLSSNPSRGGGVAGKREREGGGGGGVTAQRGRTPIAYVFTLSKRLFERKKSRSGRKKLEASLIKTSYWG